ncbi:1,4-dihydroxy-2-naphthoate polyprenyltransferase [Amphibacillus indicireducens]|uniref:1,4-dihydroxy-2-naphthoate polyprenyltransferase n=1 Tax=Amphibacillus indicireducens TaxID=1076330 RepID=A0ABP7VWU9_9BACI
MSFRSFLKLVEIQTKIASLFPFLIGLLFVIFKYDQFNLVNTLIFFSTMLLFDLTTTAINNYVDYQKASSKTYRERDNVIGQIGLPLNLVRATILIMLITSIGLGLWLVYRTDLLILLVGMLFFAIGIFYTFGPIPLSRMPLGEVFSGMTMGFGIIFLTVYINASQARIASLRIEGLVLQFNADLLLLFHILIIALPSVLTIANLMLANNICDLEDDIKNHRYTLPYYIGKQRAIYLFNALYVLTFISVVGAVLLNLVPTLLLGIVIIIVPIYKNVKKFNLKQVKSETFSLAVKNLILINGTIVILFGMALIWI